MNPQKEENMSDREPRRILVRSEPKKEEPLRAQIGEITSIKSPAKYAAGRALVKRYDPETKALLEIRIRELFNLGGKHHEIAEHLNKEGWTNSDGGPFKAHNMAHFCARMGLTRHGKKEEVKAPPPRKPIVEVVQEKMPEPIRIQTSVPRPGVTACDRPHVSDEMISILKSSDISDSKKVKLILAYLE